VPTQEPSGLDENPSPIVVRLMNAKQRDEVLSILAETEPDPDDE
jgi:hypothetical protein